MTTKHAAIPTFALVLAGCLQVETPKPAGSLVTELESIGLDPASSFVTGDGWTITVETAALSLGEVRLMGERCDQYSESNYLRVLDLRRLEVQRVNVGFALGECHIGFSTFTPASDAVIGAGIDEGTVAFMRVAGTDPFVTDRGVVFLVTGYAEKSELTVRFAWPFRQAFDFDCMRVNLGADVAQTVRLHARVPALFQWGGEDAAPRFDVIAAADGDADGKITLEELAAAPSTNGDAESLGEELYFTAMPAILSLSDGGRCRVGRIEIGRRRD